MPAKPRRRKLRIATWNINSLRLRQGLLKPLVDALDPDVICLQETKVPDEFSRTTRRRRWGSATSPTRG